MYLVDTNVLSEIRSRRADPGVVSWFEQVDPRQLHMSVITDMEAQRGILLLQRRDPAAAMTVRRWLDSVRSRFEGRVLSISVEVARVCAVIRVPDDRPLADALIAATAMHHGLTVVTRNEKDFDVPGLSIINPFSAR